MARLPGIPSPHPGEPIAERRLAPMRCLHVASSHGVISAAAQEVAGGRALVLGAGACLDVPLPVLASHFDQVGLLDSDPESLRSAVGALEPSLRTKVHPRQVELSGTAGPYLAQVQKRLALSQTPEEAIQNLVELCHDGVLVPRPSSQSRVDLVIAPCVLSQLGIALHRETRALFACRFPDLGDTPLTSSLPWVQAQLDLAHAVQRAFVKSLECLVAPEGRVVLTATVQTGQVTAEDDGQWSTPGWYRMLQTRHLRDLIGQGWRVRFEGEWPWVESSPVRGKAPGLVYRVEALVLEPSTS